MYFQKEKKKVEGAATAPTGPAVLRLCINVFGKKQGCIVYYTICQMVTININRKSWKEKRCVTNKKIQRKYSQMLFHLTIKQFSNQKLLIHNFVVSFEELFSRHPIESFNLETFQFEPKKNKRKKWKRKDKKCSNSSTKSDKKGFSR